MVRLLKPELAARHLRPLLRLGRHADRRQGVHRRARRDGRKANLFGQEFNGTVWSIAKMNMLLHGISTPTCATTTRWPSRSTSKAAS
jgi:type I restriction enzyme M protein